MWLREGKYTRLGVMEKLIHRVGIHCVKVLNVECFHKIKTMWQGVYGAGVVGCAVLRG